MTATLIRVGAKPDLFAGRATFFDGRSAKAVAVRVLGDETANAMVISDGLDVLARWAFADLREMRDQAGQDQLILTSKGDPLARVILADPETMRSLRARAPNLGKAPPVRGKGRLLAWALAAIASVALILVVIVPALADRLAVLLPPAGEAVLGDTTFEQVRSALDRSGLSPLRVCDSREGAAALGELQKRVSGDVLLPYPLKVSVLDHPMQNAFALPGGQIVFFRGLIEAAEDPDEIAAVFAHELGHVVARDPTRIALRSAGSIGILGLLLGDFAGGTVVLFLTERLIQANYTQEAEAAADAYAFERMAAAEVSPAALAALFNRLRAEHGDAEGFVAHFLSHPSLGDRIAAARAAAEASGPYRPALSDAEWTALREICR